MNHIRITIGVGCGLRKDKSHITPEERAKMVARAKQHLLTMCGGYTMTHADGGWRDNSRIDWEEPSLGFVAIIGTDRFCKDFPEILAAHVRDIFEQVCVMLTVEPLTMKFI